MEKIRVINLLAIAALFAGLSLAEAKAAVVFNTGAEIGMGRHSNYAIRKPARAAHHGTRYYRYATFLNSGEAETIAYHQRNAADPNEHPHAVFYDRNTRHD